MKNLYFYQVAILPKACTLPVGMMNSMLQLIGMFFKIITKITNLSVKSSLPEGRTKDSMILSGKVHTDLLS